MNPTQNNPLDNQPAVPVQPVVPVDTVVVAQQPPAVAGLAPESQTINLVEPTVNSSGPVVVQPQQVVPQAFQPQPGVVQQSTILAPDPTANVVQPTNPSPQANSVQNLAPQPVPQAQPTLNSQEVTQAATAAYQQGGSQTSESPVAKKTPLVTLVAKLTFRGGEESGPKTLFTKIIGIVVIVVALVLSVGNIYAARHIQNARHELKEYSNPNAAKKEADIKKAIKESEPETQKISGSKVDVSKLFDANLAARPQDIFAKYNEQINIANGASFAVLESERGWDTGDKYTQPATGKEFVKIKISVGYRGAEGTKYLSSYDFKLKNSKGGMQDTKSMSSDKLPDNELDSSSGSLNPGDSRVGYLVYEIDKGEQVVLVYQAKGFDYENSNGKEFMMSGSVEIEQ